MFVLKFANRAHAIDDEAGEALRTALERGERFVTISIDFSGCGEAVYPVTINTAHVQALINRRPHTSVLRSLPEDLLGLRPSQTPVPSR
jgi:hypothetical protein